MSTRQYQFAGTEKGRKAFSLLPDGEYTFEVLSLEPREGKANIDSLKLSEVDSGTYVFDDLIYTANAEWKVRQFLEAVRLIEPGQMSVAFDPDDVKGLRLRARIFTETYPKRDGTQGKQNRVGEYLPIEQAPGAFLPEGQS